MSPSVVESINATPYVDELVQTITYRDYNICALSILRIDPTSQALEEELGN
jgi:hypothetical protein